MLLIRAAARMSGQRALILAAAMSAAAIAGSVVACLSYVCHKCVLLVLWLLLYCCVVSSGISVIVFRAPIIVTAPLCEFCSGETQRGLNHPWCPRRPFDIILLYTTVVYCSIQ